MPFDGLRRNDDPGIGEPPAFDWLPDLPRERPLLRWLADAATLLLAAINAVAWPIFLWLVMT